MKPVISRSILFLSSLLFLGSSSISSVQSQKDSYGMPITIRQLLHHTSGLRDYNTLVALGGKQLAEYAGEYFSEELNVTYILKLEGDKLYYQRTRSPQTNLTPIIKDTFTANPIQFNFLRDRQQRISGFTINAGHVRNLHFIKKAELVHSQ